MSAQIEELNAQSAKLHDVMENTVQEHASHIRYLRSEHDAELGRSRAEAILERDEAVRKAKNDVEDVWEGRWRDRMRLAGEEVGAAFGERKQVADCWEEQVRSRWPDEVDELKKGVDRRLKWIQNRERGTSGEGSGNGSGPQ